MKMAECRLTLKERVSTVKFYYETKNAAKVVRRSKGEYPDSEAPDRVTFYYNRFRLRVIALQTPCAKDGPPCSELLHKFAN